MAALPTQDEDLSELFKLMDVNGNGSLHDKELFRIMAIVHPGLTFDQLKAMFHSIDDFRSDKEKSQEKHKVYSDNKITAKEFVGYFKKQFAKDSPKEFHQRIVNTKKTIERKAKISEVFRHFDEDKNGSLDRTEVFHMAQVSNPEITQEASDKIFAQIDTDHDSKVSEDDFVQYFFHTTEKLSDDEFQERLDVTLEGHRQVKLRMVFRAYDKDADDILDLNEFANMLKMNGSAHKSSDEIINMVNAVDKDGDRKVTYKEFMAFMGKISGTMSDKKFSQCCANMMRAARH